MKRINELNEGIDCRVTILELIPDDDPNKPLYLAELASQYQLRFDELGDAADIARAIELGEHAARHLPTDDSSRPWILSNLCGRYWELFQCRGQLEHLKRSIACLEEALHLNPDGHLDIPTYLVALAHLYNSLFDITGRLGDLESSISSKERVVNLTPDGHPEGPTRLNNLGVAYSLLYQRLGRLDDLDRYINCIEQAVDLTPNNDPNKPTRLSNLGGSYLQRYQRLGQLGDLDKSVGYNQIAVDLTPDIHPDRHLCLGNLGESYGHLYMRLDRLDDLDKSISFLEQAIYRIPNGHFHRPGRLNNLGNLYHCLYQRLGRLSDLDKSISCQEPAVNLIPDGHPTKPGFLSNLGGLYWCLHMRLGRPGDLDRSVSYAKQALDLTPDDHPDKPMYLHNLSAALHNRFVDRGNLSDIEELIVAREHSINLTPENHPARPMRLHDLGVAYSIVFNHLRRTEHSSKAIYYFNLALSLLPSDSPEIPQYLIGLGGSCALRFAVSGNMQDANQALTHLAEAERLCSDDHPYKNILLTHLGSLHWAIFVRTKQIDHGLSAMMSYRAAAHIIGASPSSRLESSRQWGQLAAYFSSAPLEGYRYGMALLSQVVWLGTSMTDRHAAISRDVGNLVATAACFAIRFQQYDLALEWMEQGRSIVWGQLLQLRTPLDELSDHCPKLVEELQELSSKLESASILSLIEQPPVVTGGLLHDTSIGQRRLAERREELLESARMLPGFEDFLLPPKAEKLTGLMKEGVAVVVNMHGSQCDALVIRSQTLAISHVPLLGFSFQEAEQLHNQLKSCMAAQGSRRGVRKGECKPSFDRILSLLWHKVVKPVINHLGINYDPLLEDLPHITWCTTGPLSFLPLHAAGDYSHPSTALPYLAVSSYTPTISALAQPCGTSSDTFSGLLAVGHASPVRGLSPLPGTKAELDKVASYAAGIKMTRLDEENACADAVLQALNEHSWVHFACHGSQNPLEPMKSALHLHDQDLTLSTIAGNRLKNGQLAFLSACQTATGDSDLPDESIHLAAGLLMAGYPAVIATMWSIDDRDAPIVAGKVYECLLQNNFPDSRKAAKALHVAVASLRESIGADQFARWVPYVHIGR